GRHLEPLPLHVCVLYRTTESHCGDEINDALVLRSDWGWLIRRGFAVRTMPASAVAAVSALQMVGGGEDHVGAVPVVVFAFDGFGGSGHPATFSLPSPQ